MSYNTIGFVAAHYPEAQQALVLMTHRYGNHPIEDADVVVCLGGDGYMLRTLHAAMDRGVPVYGMNRGSVGFLMNTFNQDDLPERLENSEAAILHPLHMEAHDLEGNIHTALAINEVSLLRETRLAAKISISIDGKERMEEMICDGVLVSTPAGSTAYNASAHGPIMPIGSELLALTAISAYRPSRWRGALLPREAIVTIGVRKPQERRVSATADYTEVRNIEKVIIREDKEATTTLLFDPEHNLNERIIKEQFLL
ncbi:MAG: NAD kinase [Rhodospirillales bacterium]|jgi:NAD+ kinase|nr:NAD kinase [Rhodospirillales bacterium]